MGRTERGKRVTEICPRQFRQVILAVELVIKEKKQKRETRVAVTSIYGILKKREETRVRSNGC